MTDRRKKISADIASATGVKLDNIYYLRFSTTHVGKYCEQCHEYKPIRVWLILDAFRKGRKLSPKCRECMRPGHTYTNSGYVYVLDKEHPAATNHGYVFEHRLVMESYIGRYLLPTETVHHKNGVRDDNRIDNLQLRTGQHGAGVAVSCGDCGGHNIKYDALV